MRLLLTLIGVTLASQVNAAEPLRVDDVPIRAGLHGISAPDLRPWESTAFAYGQRWYYCGWYFL
jgi:hypothetical protein